MGKTHGPDKPKSKDIRKRAELLLLQKHPGKEHFLGNIDELINELRVHQAELEIQNETLRESQSELHESLDKYSTLYDFSPIAYFTINRDGLIEEVNLSGASFLGVDRRKLLKRSFLHFVHPEDQRAFSTHLHNTMATGFTVNENLRIICRDGTVKWGYMESIARLQADETPSGILSSVLDMTSFREEQKKRFEAEETFRAVAENAPDIFACFDRELRFIYVNQQAELLSGIPRDEFVGRTFGELGMQPDLIALWNEMIQSVFHTGRTASLETGFPAPGNKSIYHVLAFPEFIEKGNVQHVMTISRDITGRKNAENELRTSKERLDLALKAGRSGIFDYDMEHGMGSWSDELLDLYGYKRGEVGGGYEGWTDSLVPEDRGIVAAAWKSAMETGEFDMEFRIRRRDTGEIRWMHGHGQVFFDDEGRAARMIGINIDITDFKRSEEDKKKLEIQLTQSQKMEALGTLAGGIAHDFNNILTAIMGYVEIAKLHAAMPEKLQKNLENALKSSKRAKDLISQILSFSRHASGGQTLINLNYTIEESLNMLRSMIPANIEIRHNLVSPGRIMADPSQINQLIMNLSINAAQAIGVSGGVLEVDLEEVSLDEAAAHVLNVPAGPFLRITVNDTGKGMSPEVMMRIFEPYFTTKKESGSTGMGLALVHGIVKRHGGSITCQSTPGAGTTFEVYLPEAGIEEKEEGPSVKAAVPTGTERILFVDDEKALVEVAENLLSGLGYKVTALTGSTEALELFRKDPGQFDLVVTDMTMPDMMGDKLAQEILATRPDIPILMYTGFSEYITEDKAKNLGIRQLIMKPFQIEDLAKSIRKELDKNQIDLK